MSPSTGLMAPTGVWGSPAGCEEYSSVNICRGRHLDGKIAPRSLLYMARTSQVLVCMSALTEEKEV